MHYTSDTCGAGGRPLCREGDFPTSLDPPRELAALPGEAVTIIKATEVMVGVE